jgi:uncharacterized protein YcbX
MSNITLSGLFMYPIKGARGIEVSSARVSPLGLEYDRRFVLVDPEGNFVTQREHSSLALVETSIDADTLVVRAPGHDVLRLPLHPEGLPDRTVHVWGDRCRATFVGSDAANYFSAYFQTPLELVYMPDDEARAVDTQYAKRGEKVSFADAFPFLLTTEESLADLNARLIDGVGMNRFRPNIVVRGAPPWAEDTWTNMAIGNVVFQSCKPCQRCQVITIDQATGIRGKDPLATLATFRARSNKVYFGWNLIAEGAGLLHVGDRVSLLGSP